MQKIVLVLFISILLCSCGILPGMQNPDTPRFQKVPNSIRVEPVIVPITASLIATAPPPSYIYHVAPQDVLSIIVWQHPEFNPPAQQLAMSGTPSSQAAGQSGYLVSEDGNIYFPLIGYINVADKTPDQVRIELTYRLKKYIKNPQVMVRVADYRSKKVYILGEVNRPGLFPLNDQVMSITDALTLAGSFNPEAADTRHIYIIRGNYACPKIYWLDARTPDVLLLAEHFHLQPDDIMYVSSALVTRWNRFLNQLLPTLGTVFFIKSVTGK